MSKKEIIILVVVFLLVFLLSSVTTYSILNSGNGNEPKTTKKEDSSDVLKLEKYTLKYGDYKGYESEYNDSKKKVEKKEVTITLTKDKINGEKYEVKGNKLVVNGVDLYEATANNKLELLAGEGVEYTYE